MNYKDEDTLGGIEDNEEILEYQRSFVESQQSKHPGQTHNGNENSQGFHSVSVICKVN